MANISEIAYVNATKMGFDMPRILEGIGKATPGRGGDTLVDGGLIGGIAGLALFLMGRSLIERFNNPNPYRNKTAAEMKEEEERQHAPMNARETAGMVVTGLIGVGVGALADSAL